MRYIILFWILILVGCNMNDDSESSYKYITEEERETLYREIDESIAKYKKVYKTEDGKDLEIIDWEKIKADPNINKVEENIKWW